MLVVLAHAWIYSKSSPFLHAYLLYIVHYTRILTPLPNDFRRRGLSQQTLDGRNQIASRVDVTRVAENTSARSAQRRDRIVVIS